MFNGETGMRLGDLPADTRNYFMKLPGHDTLRMVLARKTILVEGPSDELIVQRAYKQIHGRMPLEDGVEVITVNSLAFKRFLDIAKLMNLEVAVVTDNDGDPNKVAEKYEDYSDEDNIKICYSNDSDLKSLEPHLVAVNGLASLTSLLNKNFNDDDELTTYMSNNKAAVALKLFESGSDIIIPDYIVNAVS